MNHFIRNTTVVFAAVFLVTVYASCVKDRLQPAVVIIVPPIDSIPVINVDTTLHLLDYWSFNTNDTSTLLIPTFAMGSAAISYVTNFFDDVNPGSSLNLRNNDTTGDALRMRNPFTSITFAMPTTGYKNPVFTFATQRSNSGPTANGVYYTIDGTTFINNNLTTTSIALDTAWALKKISFAGIAAVNNNPKFAIQLVTQNNNTGASGNDRYDNVSLEANKQ